MLTDSFLPIEGKEADSKVVNDCKVITIVGSKNLDFAKAKYEQYQNRELTLVDSPLDHSLSNKLKLLIFEELYKAERIELEDIWAKSQGVIADELSKHKIEDTNSPENISWVKDLFANCWCLIYDFVDTGGKFSSCSPI